MRFARPGMAPARALHPPRKARWRHDRHDAPQLRRPGSGLRRGRGRGRGRRGLCGEGELLRPPGGQDERALAAACLKCDRCRSACPTGAVAVASVGDGFLRARTPVLDFHKGYCDFCGKCIEVCPTGALRSFDETAEKLGVAVVQKDRAACPISRAARSARTPAPSTRWPSSTAIRWWTATRATAAASASSSARRSCTGQLAGGTRRGIVVVPPEAAGQLGRTVVEDGSEMGV